MLEYHHLLEIHLLELLRVLQHYRRQYVQTQVEVVALICQVRIEESESNLCRELSQQQTSDPLKIQVIKVDILVLEMIQQLWVDSLKYFLHLTKRLENPWP